MKKYEEPLQSMITQTQSLGGRASTTPDGAPPGPASHAQPPPPPPSPTPPPPPPLVPLRPGHGAPAGARRSDPEQVAWRKLQEEYYQEKRRQQEMHPHPHHHRMMSELGVAMMRAPPALPQQAWRAAVGAGAHDGRGRERALDRHAPGGAPGPALPRTDAKGPPQRRGGPGGYPGNPGGGLPMEAMGHQRPPRSELFRALEKRQLQGLHRLEMDRLAKQQQQQQQQQQQGAFPNSGMGRPSPPRGDPMDFPGSRGMMGSPMGGAGPSGRDLVEMNMNANMGLGLQMSAQQQQQQMMLASFPGATRGGYLPQEPGPDMFRPDQQGLSPMGGTSRLSHMPGPRGADLGPRCSSELSLNINPMGSRPCPLTSSIMGSSLGLHSPSGSPGRLKSPAMPIASPGWAASPKTALPSPGGPAGAKGAGNGGSSSTDTGPSLPPRSTNSTPISQPGSMNPSMPFTSSPDAPPSQNPLSLIMSQMSKYAMPSSTPLYHDAIKTIATSDDEMMPDRPMMPGANMAGNMGNHQSSQMLLTPQNSMGPHSGSQSPMGMVLHGQPQLSHDPSGPMLHSPNPMGGMPGMNPAMMGGGGGGGPDGMGPCNISPMLPQNQMGAFPRMQHPPHGLLHSPNPGMPQQFHPGPEDVGIPHHQLHLLSKGLHHQRAPTPRTASPMSMGDGPDLSDVIRPTPTGIPEFDLSRIIPSDKPSSTLQYFPKSEAMSQPGPNPHPPPPQGAAAPSPPPHHLKQHPSSGPPNSSAPSSNPTSPTCRT
ncbi:hypothetical protein ANANG_G00163760 [Anguilla anguilla]|uniref:B-cell lymphoma 9 beta-catenin binding domain-containing protein n=1 Tax=Anguilla anguilla TaxID=7936 RepID=A0A9D3RVD5_ANGAN|nr:hypothetical protein ANANG_G00163760 [Anguilla anguilla]